MQILAVHGLAVNGALPVLCSVKKCLIHSTWRQKVSYTFYIVSKSVFYTLYSVNKTLFDHIYR